MLEKYIYIDCLPAVQPIGCMYVAVIDSKLLQGISYTDVRRLEAENKGTRQVEDYIGIQRPLNSKREKEIGKYVNLVDATFPNSIILSMSSDKVSYDETTKKLKIANTPDAAKVLDGQHRIAGLRHFKGESFQCIVTIYVDMELEDQAVVFATINKEQVGVNKSLVADLYEFAETRSPQKTCHNIARALNAKQGSPFFHKIKILGVANDSEKETLTQDTFVKSLIKYLSKDPQEDRDLFKRQKSFLSSAKPVYDEKRDGKDQILRKVFLSDEEDVKIAQIMWNYFSAVQSRWPDAWLLVREEYILNKSTGFIAMMKLFKDIYIATLEEVPSKDDFAKFLNRSTIKEEDFIKTKYIPGSTGQSALYKDLHSQIFEEK